MILLLCLNIVIENEMPVLFLIFIGPPKDYTWNRFSLDLNGISLKKYARLHSYLRLKKFAFYSLSSYHLGVVLEGASDLRVTWVNRLCDQAEKHWIQVLSKGLTFSFPCFFSWLHFNQFYFFTTRHSITPTRYHLPDQRVLTTEPNEEGNFRSRRLGTS